MLPQWHTWLKRFITASNSSPGDHPRRLRPRKQPSWFSQQGILYTSGVRCLSLMRNLTAGAPLSASLGPLRSLVDIAEFLDELPHPALWRSQVFGRIPNQGSHWTPSVPQP